MTWSEVPEEDRLEQEREVVPEPDDPESDVKGRSVADRPIEAPVDDVLEQRQDVAVDDDERYG
jgi:hypothetical protein